MCGRRCGVERWDVKTLSDPERHEVNLVPIPASVESLAALPRPDVQSRGRAAPVELTTFVVEAFLVAWDNEADEDIHIVLADPRNPRFTLVAEIPDPGCAGSCASGLGEQFARARASLAEVLQRPNPNDEPIRIRVSGVGFFDRNHGQLGAAPNFIELHPVLTLVAF